MNCKWITYLSATSVYGDHKGEWVNENSATKPTSVNGIKQAAPAPRFSRTEPKMPPPPVAPGNGTQEILAGLGLSESEIAGLKGSGAVA